jgi:RNA polymerase primary sigma factor
MWRGQMGEALDAYCSSISGLPVFTREQELLHANAVCAARVAYRAAVLRNPLAAREVYEVLCRVRDGELPFERTIRECGSEGLGAAAIRKRLPGHLAELKRRLRREGGSDRVVALLEDLPIRIQKLYPLEATLNRLLDRMDELTGSTDPAHARELAAVTADVGDGPDELRAKLAEAGRCRRAYDAARRRMAEGNLRLVVLEATKHRKCKVPMSDIVQDGVVGLMRAVDRYEPKLGFAFATYALIWIRQAISKAVSDTSRTVRVPVHVSDKLRGLRAVAEEVAHRLGRTPTAADLAAGSGLAEGKMRHAAMAGVPPTSLDEPLVDAEGEGRCGRDYLFGAASDRPDLHAERAGAAVAVGAVLAVLPYRERAVVEMRFGLGDGHQYSADDVAAVVGGTADEVLQAEADAVSRLRAPATAMGLGWDDRPATPAPSAGGPPSPASPA